MWLWDILVLGTLWPLDPWTFGPLGLLDFSAEGPLPSSTTSSYLFIFPLTSTYYIFLPISISCFLVLLLTLNSFYQDGPGPEFDNYTFLLHFQSYVIFILLTIWVNSTCVLWGSQIYLSYDFWSFARFL